MTKGKKIVSSLLVLSLMVLGVANIASAKTAGNSTLAKKNKNPAVLAVAKKKANPPRGAKQPRNNQVKPPKVSANEVGK